MTSLEIYTCPACGNFGYKEHEYYISDPIETKVTGCYECGYKKTTYHINELYGL